MARYEFSDLLYEIDLEHPEIVEDKADKLNQLIYDALEKELGKIGSQYELDWHSSYNSNALAAPFIYADDLQKFERDVDYGVFDDFINIANKVISQLLYQECGEQALKGSILEHKRWYDDYCGDICDDEVSDEVELLFDNITEEDK